MRDFLLVFLCFCWQLVKCYEEGQLIYGPCEKKDHALFYANDNIYHVSPAITYLEGANVKGKKLFDRESYSPIIAMTYDSQKQMLYYVEAEHPKRINAYNTFTEKSDHFDQDEEKFREITIDSMTGNIYFISNAKDIGLCNFELQKCTKLIENTNDQQTKYRNLLLHNDGLMFWIESRGSNLGVLWMANTDGSYMQQIPGLDNVSSIALNSTNSLMYFSTKDELVQLNLMTMQHKRVLYVAESILFYFDCYLVAIHRYEHKYVIYNSLLNKYAEGVWRGDAEPLLLADSKNEFLYPNTNACTDFQCSGLCVLVTNKGNKSKVKCIEEKSSFCWIIILFCVLITAILLYIAYKFELVKQLRTYFQRQTNSQTRPLSVTFNKSEDQK